MENQGFRVGGFVEVDGLVGVVVGISGDAITPEGHLAIWFGLETQKRFSEGGTGNVIPEVWTVPVESAKPRRLPTIRH